MNLFTRIHERRDALVFAGALLASVATFPACTIVGHQKVEGWPELAVREHSIPHAAMRDVCARYVGFGMSPEACAEFDLNARTCVIWYSAEFPPSESVKVHERKHCAGFDHIGGDTMQKLYDQWRAQQ